MTKGFKQFNGDRLRECREARGISATTVADLVGVSPPSISQYERKTHWPSIETVEKLGETLNIPVGRFLKPTDNFQFGMISYRSNASATKQARKRAERRFYWLYEAIRLLESCIQLPPVNFPEWEFPTNPADIAANDVEAAAMRLREFWGLKDGPLPNSSYLVEKNGAIVARHQIGAETLDAFSVWGLEEKRPFIVLNSEKNSCVRSRWDLCHEIGHLVLHRDVPPPLFDDRNIFQQMEVQAHRFAGAFLMPKERFSDEIFPATLDCFVESKTGWKVSIAGMVNRSFDLGLISKERKQRLFMTISKRRWKTREPFDDEIKIESPAMIKDAVDFVTSKSILEKSEIESSLDLYLTDIERVMGLEDGYLSHDDKPRLFLRFPK